MTSTGNFVYDNSTLANFKSWGMAVSAAFSTFGWVQTADTGQVNWSSIAAVGVVYEVWKANDAQAATAPIFVKVTYGTSTSSVTLQFTAGTGSNGAGTITGGVVTGAPWGTTALGTNQGATVFPCYFSGDAGEFRMYMWQATGVNTAGLFVIERSKDASGNKTTDYFTAIASNSLSNSSTAQQSILSPTLVAPKIGGAVGYQICSVVTSGITTYNFNGMTGAMPVFPLIGKLGNPFLGLCTAASGDVADGATVTVASVYGATHTYIVASQNNINGGGLKLLMRYD